ncbi:MAG TPA: V-type ATPase 116kDa subunit family protein, partial [Prolixibacteraceae bacterium]|nr:V-type ATPase 116kDa subunit family protein [Prolixibacteraceae bacterium]
IIFGFLSGTLFGIELAKVEWPWIQRFKSIMLDPNDLFSFSLIIGGVQILFGMTIKAIGQTIRFGFKNALSTWGWLVAIIGCGGVFGMQKLGILSQQSATVGYYITGGIAFLGIFILNDIKRNPLINIGAGLWDTYNMITGLLGDVLSYVRLFALGISGAVLGLVFNDLAIKMSPDIPVVGFLVSAVILLFGHGMNIFMAGLGSFVHPLRLTFVEFYKNAGFEGGGKKYNPFRKG